MKYKVIPIIIVLLVAINQIISIISNGFIKISLFGTTYILSGVVVLAGVIFIIAYIAYFLIRFIDANIEKFFNREKEKYFEFSHLKFKDKKLGENVIKRNAQLVEKIKKTDASFDEEFFLYHAKVLFTRLQRDALMKYMKNLRGTWDCAQSYVNYVYDNELVDVELPQIYFYSSSADRDVIKVVLKSNIVYHVLELQDMTFININRDKMAETISVMTFMKWKKRKENELSKLWSSDGK